MEASATQGLPIPRSERQLAGPDAPEIFEIGNIPDSWEYSSSSSGDDEAAYTPDEWTSQICSTVVDPRVEAGETSRVANTNTNMEAGNTKRENEAEKDASASASVSVPAGGKYPPEWEDGGPFLPDSRILMQKASLPGRKSRFVEVDVDGPAATASAAFACTAATEFAVPGSPVETTVFKDCLELLREGARTPPTLMELYGGGEWEGMPGLVKGKTWAISGALYN